LASLGIESGDGIMDGSIEGVSIGESLVGKVVAFEVAPDPFAPSCALAGSLQD